MRLSDMRPRPRGRPAARRGRAELATLDAALAATTCPPGWKASRRSSATSSAERPMPRTRSARSSTLGGRGLPRGEGRPATRGAKRPDAVRPRPRDCAGGGSWRSRRSSGDTVVVAAVAATQLGLRRQEVMRSRQAAGMWPRCESREAPTRQLTRQQPRRSPKPALIDSASRLAGPRSRTPNSPAPRPRGPQGRARRAAHAGSACRRGPGRERRGVIDVVERPRRNRRVVPDLGHRRLRPRDAAAPSRARRSTPRSARCPTWPTSVAQRGHRGHHAPFVDAKDRLDRPARGAPQPAGADPRRRHRGRAGRPEGAAGDGRPHAIAVAEAELHERPAPRPLSSVTLRSPPRARHERATGRFGDALDDAGPRPGPSAPASR